MPTAPISRTRAPPNSDDSEHQNYKRDSLSQNEKKYVCESRNTTGHRIRNGNEDGEMPGGARAVVNSSEPRGQRRRRVIAHDFAI